jgi:hypothetical protein
VERSDLPEGQQELAEKHPNRMERSELVDEVLRLRSGRDKLTATIAAFPDAHNAANLAHARMERDGLRAEVARVRAEAWAAARSVVKAVDFGASDALMQAVLRGFRDDVVIRMKVYETACRIEAGTPAESVVGAPTPISAPSDVAAPRDALSDQDFDDLRADAAAVRGARCSKCGGPLGGCATCGMPAQCGEAFCAQHTDPPDWSAGALPEDEGTRQEDRDAQ